MRSSSIGAAALVGVAALCIALTTEAQHDAHQALPPAATELHPGLGDYHFAITTANADAQVYFDHGIRLLYGFNHDEAARYFRRAAELDPQAPMPYWGVALSIGPNYNDAAVDAARAQATYDAVKSARAAGGQRERSASATTLRRSRSAIRRRSRQPTGSASIASTAKRCARWWRSIPTISTPRRCSPKAS